MYRLPGSDFDQKIEVTPKKQQDQPLSVDTSIADWTQFITMIQESKLCAITVETTGSDPLRHSIKLLRMATVLPDGRRVLCQLTSSDAPDGLPSVLQRLMADAGITKVMYNAKSLLAFAMIAVKKRLAVYAIFDVLLASQLCTAGNFLPVINPRTTKVDKHYPEHSLSDLEKRHLSPTVPDDPLISLLLLYPIFAELLNRNKLEQVFDLEMGALPAVTECEISGMSLNIPRLNAMYLKQQEAVAEVFTKLKREAWNCAGIGNFNPYTTQQIKSILSRYRIPTDNLTDELLAAAAQKLPFAKLLLSYRQVHRDFRLLHSWLSAVHPADSRIHTTYNQLLPNATGRLSSHSPSLQQLPHNREYRGLFEAPADNVFIDADYAAIELRIAASRTQDENMRSTFMNGHDLHKLTAAAFTGKSIDLITTEERNLGKLANFKLLYGSSTKTLMEFASLQGSHLTQTKAMGLRSAFFRKYPAVKAYHRNKCDAKKNKVDFHFHTAEAGFQKMTLTGVRTASGRLRVWPDYNGSSCASFNELANTPIQGTGADILKRAMALIYKALLDKDWNDVRIINNIHDQLTIEAPKVKEDDVRSMLQTAMETAGKEFIDVPIVVDIDICQSLN